LRAAFIAQAFHHHAKDSAMTKNHSIVRQGSVMIYATALIGTLFAGAKTRADEPALRSLPAKTQIAAAEANAPESKIVSDVLLSALETKLKNLREQANQAQQFSAFGVDESAANVAAFLNQRIESLERMAKLIEQRQALQNAVGAYQQRLHNLQQKMAGPTRTASME
jgi:cell fate (sporulation/competence/biofilm development) regulator YlbF (YheA/YmcA/DUF963 family)